MFRIMQGLEILAKYCENERGDFSAEHDQIWAGPAGSFDPESIDDEDREELARLDWFIDDGSWSHFC